jgi:hypothetical protein
MPAYDYAEQFERELQQKYARELTSYALTQSNQGVKFMNAQTIKIPRLSVTGYKDHTRAGSYNQGSITNDWEPKKLSFDRDVEFVIDPMDIDETNLVVEVANIQNTFEEEQAIPEKDCYRYSKLRTEAQAYADAGAKIDTETLDKTNFLEYFDEKMAYMDDESVPQEGRTMYITSAVNMILKQCEGVTRSVSVGAAGVINRNVHSLDDVQKIVVPSARLKTAYDFTVGAEPASTAKQMNMILVHPSCVISRDKYSYIKLFTPGTDSRTADNYIYQNRYYSDTFLLERKAPGIAINECA